MPLVRDLKERVLLRLGIGDQRLRERLADLDLVPGEPVAQTECPVAGPDKDGLLSRLFLQR